MSVARARTRRATSGSSARGNNEENSSQTLAMCIPETGECRNAAEKADDVRGCGDHGSRRGARRQTHERNRDRSSRGVPTAADSRTQFPKRKEPTEGAVSATARRHPGMVTVSGITPTKNNCAVNRTRKRPRSRARKGSERVWSSGSE
jgi:hypothetical protein